MRDRKDIEQESKDRTPVKVPLELELLLDIRELLAKKKKNE
jgi:hypothetical protein